MYIPFVHPLCWPAEHISRVVPLCDYRLNSPAGRFDRGTQPISLAARREIASPLISLRPEAHVARAFIATRSRTSFGGRLVAAGRIPSSWKR